MKALLSFFSATTLALGVWLSAYGCSGGAFELSDGGTSATGSGSSSSTGESGNASGATGSGSSSGTVNSGTSSGAAGSGSSSGSISSGTSSGASASGSSSGSVGSGTSSGVPGSGSSSGAPHSGSSSGAPSSGASSGSGGLECNGNTCGSNELCCPGFDVYCTPTCMKVASCPALGRPCRVGDDAGAPVDSGGLRWYTTCGWGLCPAPVGPVQPACGVGPLPPCPLTDDAGAPCPPVGSPCSTKGDTCGTRSSLNCGAIEVCDDHDPRGGPGGCPLSSAKFKNDIRYIDDSLLERLHDETMEMRLATAQRLAVDRGLGHVDLYGYLSMVVAAVQVQEKEIADLRQQLGDPRAKSVCGAYQSR